mmetsp:Transcript_56829/g.130744  ORF Transcript_56829/g.130744 Transcript_56829/m.130744 type:complete len:220 (+) Transcript_56829:1210-1869(+)
MGQLRRSVGSQLGPPVREKGGLATTRKRPGVSPPLRSLEEQRMSQLCLSAALHRCCLDRTIGGKMTTGPSCGAGLAPSLCRRQEGPGLSRSLARHRAGMRRTRPLSLGSAAAEGLILPGTTAPGRRWLRARPRLSTHPPATGRLGIPTPANPRATSGTATREQTVQSVVQRCWGVRTTAGRSGGPAQAQRKTTPRTATCAQTVQSVVLCGLGVGITMGL